MRESSRPFCRSSESSVLLAVWSLATWRQWVDPVLLPSPSLTFDAMWKGMHGALGFDFIKTV